MKADKPATTRDPTAAERAAIEAVLNELRQHFREWSAGYPSELELVRFAVYEGCGSDGHCRGVLEKAAPFAVAKELVERDGYRWVMIEGDAGCHYGVAHPSLRAPVDLMTLVRGVWNDEQYDEKPDPVQVISDSYKPLAAAARGPGHGR